MLPTLAILVLSLRASLPPAGADVAQVAAVLERDRNRSTSDAALLRRELIALGSAAQPDLFHVLAFGPGAEPALGPEESTALLEALCIGGRTPVRPLLAKSLAGTPQAEVRLAALEVLAYVGTSADLDLLRRALVGGPPGLEEALQAASAAIVRADVRALEGLRRWMIESPALVGAPLARGLGDSAEPAALATLAETLGFHAELDPELLDAIARLAPALPKPLDEESLAPVRAALESEDPRTLRAAALALGQAEDPAACAGLIPLLAHETRGVRVAAQGALEGLSGLAFGADPQRWQAWLAAEEAWWNGSLERLRAELEAPEPGLAIRALGELSSHRWPRHQLALEATAALRHEDPAVRRLACLALARIGSSAAIPELETLVEADGESVAAARRALQSLTSGATTAVAGRAHP